MPGLCPQEATKQAYFHQVKPRVPRQEIPRIWEPQYHTLQIVSQCQSFEKSVLSRVPRSGMLVYSTLSVLRHKSAVYASRCLIIPLRTEAWPSTKTRVKPARRHRGLERYEAPSRFSLMSSSKVRICSRSFALVPCCPKVSASQLTIVGVAGGITRAVSHMRWFQPCYHRTATTIGIQQR